MTKRVLLGMPTPSSNTVLEPVTESEDRHCGIGVADGRVHALGEGLLKQP